MEVFISSCDKDEKSRFIEILSNYMQITERKLGKIVKLDKTTQNLLKVTNTPLLVSPKVKDPISENVIAVAKQICEEAGFLPLFFGKDKVEQEKIEKFTKHIIEELKFDSKKLMAELNKSLLLETFIGASLNITVCDILAYSVLAPHLNNLSNADKTENCNVLRWADHIQSLPGIKETAKNLKLTFSLPYEQFVLTVEGPVDKKQAKKDKKEKAKQEKAGKQKEPQKEVHHMSKVDIRVGKVVNIFPNPEGDKLYNEEIDLGNGEIRKIASGLRGRVDINDLKDSLVVVICNLEPRNLKGWQSHGMILCASAEEGHDGKVEPLRPPKDSQPGDLVYIGDLPREPVADKKCPWSKVAKDLKVNENLQATYKGELVWRTDKGEIKATTLKNAIIS